MCYSLKSPILTNLSRCWSIPLHSWNCSSMLTFTGFKSTIFICEVRKCYRSLIILKIKSGTPAVRHLNWRKVKSAITSGRKKYIIIIKLYYIHLWKMYTTGIKHIMILDVINTYICFVFLLYIHTYIYCKCVFHIYACLLCVLLHMFWNIQLELPKWIQSTNGQPVVP